MLHIDLSQDGISTFVIKNSYPSLVITIPPIGSNNIFNIACGPRVDVTIYDTAYDDLKISESNTDDLKPSIDYVNYLCCLNIGELSLSSRLSL